MIFEKNKPMAIVESQFVPMKKIIEGTTEKLKYFK